LCPSRNLSRRSTAHARIANLVRQLGAAVGVAELVIAKLHPGSAGRVECAPSPRRSPGERHPLRSFRRGSASKRTYRNGPAMRHAACSNASCEPSARQRFARRAKMMHRTGLPLLVVATALGCDGLASYDDGDQANVDPVTGAQASVDSTVAALRDDGTTFFVYDNQRVCVTAPCPSYTVITPGGVRFDVARVIVEPGAERADRLLRTGGLLTRGTILNGSWQPGRPGPGLSIRHAGEAARIHLVAEHPAGHDHPYCSVATREVNHEVDAVDLEGLVPAPGMDCPQEVDTLVNGDWATKGFLTRSDTGETVLYASMAAGETEDFHAISSGIECVTLPCPIWALSTADGKPLGNAARLDLSFLLLSPAETAALEDKLFRSGGLVRGFLDRASWNQGSGPTLLVAGLNN
jgi:hypothetical protein